MTPELTFVSSDATILWNRSLEDLWRPGEGLGSAFISRNAEGTTTQGEYPPRGLAGRAE